MNKLLLSLLTPVALFAINGPTIAPTGWDLYLKMGPSGDLVNNGGRFDSYISNAPIPSSATTAAPLAANMWCVDAQLQFQYGVNYRTNSLGFEEINGESTTKTGPQVNSPNQQPWTQGQRDVRYEDVQGYATSNNTSNGVDNFLKALPITLVNGTDGALFRYRMAAYLLDQYQSSTSVLLSASDPERRMLAAGSVGTGKYDPLNNDRNKSIINAIWRAMDTEYDTTNQGSANGDTLFWYTTAAQYVDTNWADATKWSKWAVVSAWVADCDPNNNSPCYVRNNNGSDANRVQTFLTERNPPPPSIPDNPVPEPGFYGLLATGVSGLFWFASRRKKNLEN